MDGRGDAFRDQRADEIAGLLLMGQVDGRRRAIGAAVNVAHIDRLGEMRAPAGRSADEEDRLVGGGEADPRHPRPVGNKADAADGRGRQNALAVGLVVERDVARNDREIQRAAGFADALDGMDELAHDLRALGIAEIEVVGGGERQGAGRGEVAPAFGDRLLAALERIGLAIARRDVGGEGERLDRVSLDAHDTSVAARNLQRIALDQRVVLLPHPAARGAVGGIKQLQQRVGHVRLRDVSGGQRSGLLRLDPRPVVFGRLVAEILDRQVRDFLALMQDAEAQIVRGAADNGEVEAPFGEDRLGFLLLLGAQHHEHALLAFREHHLIGRHALLAHRHAVEIQLDAEVALGAHLDGGAGEAGRAHVLDGDDRAGRHQL